MVSEFAARYEGDIGRSLAIGPHDAVLRRHRARMSSSAAKQAYRLRKQLVEPVFGIIKEQQGARRFLLRSLTNVAAEWTMLATAFNLRTLCRVWSSPSPSAIRFTVQSIVLSHELRQLTATLSLHHQHQTFRPGWSTNPTAFPNSPSYPQSPFWDRLYCELFGGKSKCGEWARHPK